MTPAAIGGTERAHLRLPRWSGLAIGVTMVAAVVVLVAIDWIEEPHLTFGQIMMEAIEPALLVGVAGAVAFLYGRFTRQQREHALLMGDLDVARAEGAQWRADMRELLRGLSAAIDAQFHRWQLTQAEREVALLMLKGLSHKEVAAARSTSERTVRQQAQSVYRKSDLAGRAALSAFLPRGSPSAREPALAVFSK